MPFVWRDPQLDDFDAHDTALVIAAYEVGRFAVVHFGEGLARRPFAGVEE